MTTPITGEIIIPLAGLQYYRLRDCNGAIMQGTRLRLTRQPDNQYDPDAILVELHAADLEAEEMPLPDGMVHGAVYPLGHIPATTTERDWASLLSARLDDGLSAECFFHEGERNGAWSVWVRVSGPAVECIQRQMEAEREAADAEFRALPIPF